jgi:hypothetical protein
MMQREIEVNIKFMVPANLTDEQVLEVISRNLVADSGIISVSDLRILPVQSEISPAKTASRYVQVTKSEFKSISAEIYASEIQSGCMDDEPAAVACKAFDAVKKAELRNGLKPMVVKF